MPAGRPIGSRNWVPQDVKQSIMSVYEGLDGAKGLLSWAKRNQTEYYRMLVSILPKEQKIEFANPLMTVSADDLARLISAIARGRGITIPSSIERMAEAEAGTLQALPQAEGIPCGGSKIS